jgi:hypothetical protein
MKTVLEGNYNPLLLHEELVANGADVTLNYKETENGVSILLEFDEEDENTVNSTVAAHNPAGESVTGKAERRYNQSVQYLKNLEWDELRDAIAALPQAQRNVVTPIAKAVRALAVIAINLDREIN